VSRREDGAAAPFLCPRREVLDRFTIMDEVWGVRYEAPPGPLISTLALLRIEDRADPAPSEAPHDGSRDRVQVYRETGVGYGLARVSGEPVKVNTLLAQERGGQRCAIDESDSLSMKLFCPYQFQ